MDRPPETEAEIKEEMEELGVDNDATGSPDIFLSQVTIKVIAGIFIVLMLAGLLLLVF